MSTSLNLINLISLLSPLDQFGSDSVNFNVTPFVHGIFGSLDVLNLIDLFDVSFLQGLMSTFTSINIFEDDDSADSAWEDNESNTSGIQSSIFISNIIGMVPGVETTTSDAVLTFFYSFSTMTTIIMLGFSLHSIRFLASLFPSGTPLVMTPFIILIEFVSYMARAISLGMRLFANMFAGHSLVKILMSFAWLFLNSALPILSIPVFVLLLVIFFMEVGIAYLQAYVFGSLINMYFEDAISGSH